MTHLPNWPTDWLTDWPLPLPLPLPPPTNWPKLCRPVLLVKLIVMQLVKKFPALQRITVFVRACHWLIFWARWTQSTASCPSSLRSSLILYFDLCLCLLYDIFTSGIIKCVHFSSLPCVWWSVQCMNILNMPSFPAFQHFLSRKFKYSP
jgi:hypothetical protein